MIFKIDYQDIQIYYDILNKRGSIGRNPPNGLTLAMKHSFFWKQRGLVVRA